jgi:hypothetical protein
MVRYGEAPIDNPVLTNFRAKKQGIFPFKLYLKLWASSVGIVLRKPQAECRQVHKLPA